MPKKKKIPVEISNADGGISNLEILEIDMLFLEAYLANGFNATQAYLGLHPDSSYTSARNSASEILAKPDIQAIRTDRINKMAMPANEVIARISNIAMASQFPFIKYQSDGFVYYDFSHPEAKDHLYLIKKLKTKRERRVEGSGNSAEEWEGEWVEVELHDAHAALRDLGRFHKLFVDRTESANYNIELPWEDLTPDQILRLRNGADPAIIKKEIDERKSAAK